MSRLEVALLVVSIVSAWSLIHLYRKHLILRHIFIQSSDWCAFKIKEMAEAGSYEIIELAKAISEDRGQALGDEAAKGWVPDILLEAEQQWVRQKDAFQAKLVSNGMRRLDLHDKDDPILSPGWSGIR